MTKVYLVRTNEGSYLSYTSTLAIHSTLEGAVAAAGRYIAWQECDRQESLDWWEQHPEEWDGQTESFQTWLKDRYSYESCTYGTYPRQGYLVSWNCQAYGWVFVEERELED